MSPWNPTLARTPSRAPRRAFFALAALLAVRWGSDVMEREGLQRAALTYDLGTVEAMMNVITAIEVVLGLGVVVSLLVLCLAPRSARVTFPAQLAATVAALGVLIRGGTRLLLASGAFAATPGSTSTSFAHYAGIAVTFTDLAGSALLLVVIARVTRAAKAHVAFGFAIVSLVLVLTHLTTYGLATFIGLNPDPLATVETVEFCAFAAYSLLLLWLCVHAGVVVTRIPDELSA